MMLPCFAPMAMRSPISRVRSVTDTSMMFMTPMPPTTSEMSAMPEMSRAMVPVVLSMVFLMLSVFTVKKSVLPWRAVSRAVRFFSAMRGMTLSFTLTMTEEMCRCPVILFMTVV